MRVSRQWRKVQLMHQHGFAPVTGKIPGPGDLAEFCPACPQPGVNLKENWVTEPDQ
jgi:hypothetical protein